MALQLDDQRFLLRQVNYPLGDMAFGHGQVLQHDLSIHRPA
ncbi:MULTISPECIES: hypothetical protein [Bradyrhizobium]|nr:MULTISPECIES: hypothetical protein [Bradyrhizobium]